MLITDAILLVWGVRCTVYWAVAIWCRHRWRARISRWFWAASGMVVDTLSRLKRFDIILVGASLCSLAYGR
jgi:hypothetical protein